MSSVQEMTLKKIKNTRFFCIDFVNCDLSKDKTIDGVEKTVFQQQETRTNLSGEEISLEDVPPTLLRRRRLLENVDMLKKIQECVRDVVARSIDQMQTKKRAHKTTVKESVLREATKLRGRFRSVADPTTSYVVSELFRDFKGLLNESCLSRILRCSQCNKFFVTRTLRSQEFCSDKCRWNYHNKEKQATGEHNKYMRDYLPKYRKRRKQT